MPLLNSPKQKLQLIGADQSYFTAKALGYLRWKELPFEEVPGTKRIYKDFILPTTGVAQIPVLVDPNNGGKVITDTKNIIDYCEVMYPSDTSAYPSTPFTRVVCGLLELYCDEWLKIPAMHYRWSFEQQLPFLMHEWDNALQAEVPPAQRKETLLRAMKQFKGSLPILGVTKDTVPGVEANFEALLRALAAHFTNHSFLFGDRPTVADFAMCGPLYAHLSRDPVPAGVVRQHAEVLTWIERTMGTSFVNRRKKWAVSEGKLVSADTPRELFADDALPATFHDILDFFFKDQLPTLLEVRKLTHAYLTKRPGSKVPRFLGKYSYFIGGKRGERTAIPYEMWMVQRVVDAYRSCPGHAQKQVAELAASHANGKMLLDLLENPLPRLALREGALYPTDDPASGYPLYAKL